MINLLRFIDLHDYMQQMQAQDPKTLHSTQKVALARWQDMQRPGRSETSRRGTLVPEVRAWLAIHDALFRQSVADWEQKFVEIAKRRQT